MRCRLWRLASKEQRKFLYCYIGCPEATNVNSIWSTAIGAIVGGAVSIGTTWLSEYLRERRTRKLDRIRQGVLKRLLSGEKYDWRSMEMLSDSIGADQETTARLLLEIGARRSLAKGRDSWGLKPWPDDLQSD